MKHTNLTTAITAFTLSIPGLCSDPQQDNSFMALSHRMVAVDSEHVKLRYKELLKRAEEKGYEGERLEQAKQFLHEATTTPYWRFYLINGGLNGPLTEYMTLYHEDYAPVKQDFFGNPLTEMDRWYFEESPFILAYQQNHRNCRKLIEKFIHQSTNETIQIASIACGTAYEFMRMQLPAEKDIKIFAYDIDLDSIKSARANGEKYGRQVIARQQDAWEELADAPFDVITCNGFTFYENNEQRLVMLFRNFYRSLKQGGTMVASFIQPKSCWNTEGTAEETWRKLGLMMDLIPSKWTAALRDKDRMRDIAIQAGFSPENISFEDEPRNIHPSIVAKK